MHSLKRGRTARAGWYRQGSALCRANMTQVEQSCLRAQSAAVKKNGNLHRSQAISYATLSKFTSIPAQLENCFANLPHKIQAISHRFLAISGPIFLALPKKFRANWSDSWQYWKLFRIVSSQYWWLFCSLAPHKPGHSGLIPGNIGGYFLSLPQKFRANWSNSWVYWKLYS